MQDRTTVGAVKPIDESEQPSHSPQVMIGGTKRQALNADFIKVEKNLASLGFFTPSNKRIRGTKEKKISITKQVDGNRIEVRAMILPSAAYGLPITGDQDKYFALQKIICDIRRQRGEIRNPVGFTSAELLRILGLRVTAGKNYEDIVSWARRMTLTGICSEGSIYLAGRKVWASDTFHVFERFVSVGNQMPDGGIADKHYVWLSDWQLENINNNHLLPVDLEAYRQLRNHIAKALVPLLQIWFYATREGGSFEKRYRDLCQILKITEYQHPSKIREKLGPSLDELKNHGYLSGWRIQEASDGKYKILLYHGAKFQRDEANRRVPRHEPSQPTVREHNVLEQKLKRSIDQEILHELMRRGISEEASMNLIRNLRSDQQVMDQLEWGDNLLRNAPKGKFYNPAGLYIHLIKENVIPPETFETSGKRNLRKAVCQAQEQEEQNLARITLAYLEHKEQELDRFIRENYSSDHLATLVSEKEQELCQQDRWRRLLSLKQDRLRALAERQVRAEISQHVPFIQFEEIRNSYLREVNATFATSHDLKSSNLVRDSTSSERLRT